MIFKFKGKKFKRIGKCKRCGQCCSTSNWIRQATYEQADKFFNDTGVPRDPFIRAQTYKQYCKKQVECLYFDPDSKLCTIWNKRPEFCGNYPTPGDPRFPNCGYEFVEVKEMPETEQVEKPEEPQKKEYKKEEAAEEQKPEEPKAEEKPAEAPAETPAEEKAGQ